MSKKYSFKEREKWIKSLHFNYHFQDWHTDKVYHTSEIKNIDFLIKHYKSYTAKINPKKIKGIEYPFEYNDPCYGNKNVDWSYMLENLKKLDRLVDNFKNKEDLISHIHTNIDKKEVNKYGDYYFTTSGQHRLCLAKYLEIDRVEVTVKEYKLDRKLFVIEKYIQKNSNKLIDLQFSSCNYEINLNTDLLYIKLHGKSFRFKKKLLKPLLIRYETLKTNKYKAFFNLIKSLGKSSTDAFENENDLFLLDYHILKHIYYLKSRI